MCITQYGALVVLIVEPPAPKPREEIVSLGIDCGGRKLAWSVSNVDKLILVSHFEAKKTDRASELSQCTEQLLNSIRGMEIDEVYVEEALIGKGVRASLQVAQMTGAVLQAFGATTQLTPTLVPVDDWKKSVCGKGGINKEAVSAWMEGAHADWLDRCRYVTPTGLDRINQDEVDAICISRMAFPERRQQLGRPPVRRGRAKARPQRVVRGVA